MAIYTVRFGNAYKNGAGSVTVYTAPTGVTSVLRDLCVSTDSAGVPIAVINDSGTGPIFFCEGTGASETFHWEGRQVILPGESLVLAVNNGEWWALATGYHLT